MKENMNLKKQKRKIPNGSIKNACCPKRVFHKFVFFVYRKNFIVNMHFFSIWSSSFLDCIFWQVRDAQKKKKWVRDPFEDKRRSISARQMLSMSVLMSVTSDSAINWQMTWQMTFFLRWNFERLTTMQVSSLRIHALSIFSNIQRLSVHVLWYSRI